MPNFIFSRRTLERVAWFIVLSTGVALAESVSAAGVAIDPGNTGNGSLASGLSFGSSAESGPGIVNGHPVIRIMGTGIVSNRVSQPNKNGLDFLTASSPRMSLTYSGKLGVNTQDPQQTIEAVGEHGSLGLESKATHHVWTIAGAGSDVNSASLQISDEAPNASPNPRLSIDSKGIVAVNILQIKGGSDLAEPFQVQDKAMAAGSVVVIDEDHAGALRLSDHSYDKRVAGIVSGAGNVKPGLTLEQLDSTSRPGARPVSLSGRVYALADTTGGPIKPGDLLTTSALAGHAMKATDSTRSRGAVIGKAMTSLSRESGLVLVLISLQ